MAQNWMDAISKLPSSWISAPQTPSTSSKGGAHEVCAQKATSYTAALGGNNIFDGSHVSGDPGTSIGPGNTFSPGWGEQQVSPADSHSQISSIVIIIPPNRY